MVGVKQAEWLNLNNEMYNVLKRQKVKLMEEKCPGNIYIENLH